VRDANGNRENKNGRAKSWGQEERESRISRGHFFLGVYTILLDRLSERETTRSVPKTIAVDVGVRGNLLSNAVYS